MPLELPSELLSGPDLGGGLLFQLTREPSPPPGTFTFHAQEAGSDAAQAPSGSPALLGFEHPPAPCMFGGPGCWHLTLPLPESERTPVRVAYNRTRFVVDPMLAQASHARPAPIAEGVRELLDRIATPLGTARVAWMIGGSAGAWLRGLPIDPADIDLGIEAAAVPRLAELLEEYLVVPNHRPLTASGPGPLRGAAFVGTLKAGVRVEWRGTDPERSTDPGPNEWYGAGWSGRITVLPWEKYSVPVAPLEFEIARLLERRQTDRIDRLLPALPAQHLDPGLLGELLDRTNAPPEARLRLENALR